MRRLHFRVFWKIVLCCVVCSCTGSPLCPRSLECALAGRHFCRPGSSHCGPCLRPLVENSRGRCVVKRRHAPHTHSVKGRCSYLLNSAVYPGILTCGLFGFNASLQGVFGTSMLALFSSPRGCRLINTDKQTRLQAEVMLLWTWLKHKFIVTVQNKAAGDAIFLKQIRYIVSLQSD